MLLNIGHVLLLGLLLLKCHVLVDEVEVRLVRSSLGGMPVMVRAQVFLRINPIIDNLLEYLYVLLLF